MGAAVAAVCDDPSIRRSLTSSWTTSSPPPSTSATTPACPSRRPRTAATDSVLGSMAVIRVDQLRKQYGTTWAVDDVSFEVAAGEVYTLLGENGAGKSTSVEILEGHREATSGTVHVLDRNPWNAGREFRDRIGIVLQSSGVETEFTVREVIELYGGCYRSPRPLDEIVGLVGLDEKVDARIGSLSGGQRRRVDLALGIVGRPEVLFLDEPTTGFDPARAPEVVGPHRIARRRRHHRAAHDALPRRGRTPRRPGGCAVRRPIDRRGDTRAADQPDQRHGRELHASRTRWRSETRRRCSHRCSARRSALPAGRSKRRSTTRRPRYIASRDGRSMPESNWNRSPSIGRHSRMCTCR